MFKNTIAARLFTSTSAITWCLCVSAMVLNGCGTALYPESKGYSYSSSKASGSKPVATGSGTVGTVVSNDPAPIPPSSNAEPEDKGVEVTDANGTAGTDVDTKVEDDIAGLDGLALYDAKCAKCHTPKATTTVGNPDVTAVKAAIKDLFIMASVKATDEELAAIQAYLE